MYDKSFHETTRWSLPVWRVLTVGSVCSSVGGFDLGMHNADLRTIWLCEADPWRRDVLANRFPDVPCWPDLTTLDPADLERPDVLIGGTPCQDLSVAGRRAGLDGERSGLFFDYIRIRNALNIEWSVWENVAGALSSNDGLDFASVLGAFVGANVAVPAGGWPGAGVATGPWGGSCWRLLDAQHFGVPQRRRRIFVVGRLGGPCPPQVLLELASGDGNLAPGPHARPPAAHVTAHLTGGPSHPGVGEPRRRKDSTDVVGTLGGVGPGSGWRVGADEAAAGQLVVGTLRGSVGNGGGGDRKTTASSSPHPRSGTDDGTAIAAAHTLEPLSSPAPSPTHPDSTTTPSEADTSSPIPTCQAQPSSPVRTPAGEEPHSLRPIMFSENSRQEVVQNEIAMSLKTGGGKPGKATPQRGSGRRCAG